MIKLTLTEEIGNLIVQADRCPNFTKERGEPCDGLEGCSECLEQAAVDIVSVLRQKGLLREDQ